MSMCNYKGNIALECHPVEYAAGMLQHVLAFFREMRLEIVCLLRCKKNHGGVFSQGDQYDINKNKLGSTPRENSCPARLAEFQRRHADADVKDQAYDIVAEP